MEPMTMIYSDKEAAERALARVTGIPTAIRDTFRKYPAAVTVHVRGGPHDVAMTFEQTLVGIVIAQKYAVGGQPWDQAHVWVYDKQGVNLARIDLSNEEIPDMV
jgi:hypothetical protein